MCINAPEGCQRGATRDARTKNTVRGVGVSGRRAGNEMRNYMGGTPDAGLPCTHCA
jgi:hypothetical protein